MGSLPFNPGLFSGWQPVGGPAGRCGNRPPALLSDFLLPSLDVTEDQVASAVQEDCFFSDRGVSTRLVQGAAMLACPRDHDLTAEFRTRVSMRASRDLGNPPPRIQVSDTLKARSAHPQLDVARQACGRMIWDCRLSQWSTWRMRWTWTVSLLPAHPSSAEPRSREEILAGTSTGLPEVTAGLRRCLACRGPKRLIREKRRRGCDLGSAASSAS